MYSVSEESVNSCVPLRTGEATAGRCWGCVVVTGRAGRRLLVSQIHIPSTRRDDLGRRWSTRLRDIVLSKVLRRTTTTTSPSATRTTRDCPPFAATSLLASLFTFREFTITRNPRDTGIRKKEKKKKRREGRFEEICTLSCKDARLSVNPGLYVRKAFGLV